MALKMMGHSADDSHLVMQQEVVQLKLTLAALKEEVEDMKAVKHNEPYYQTILEKKIGAGHMHIEGVGTTDITTDDTHIEIKRWTRADEIIGQLGRYNSAVPRPHL